MPIHGRDVVVVVRSGLLYGRGTSRLEICLSCCRRSRVEIDSNVVKSYDIQRIIKRLSILFTVNFLTGKASTANIALLLCIDYTPFLQTHEYDVFHVYD